MSVLEVTNSLYDATYRNLSCDLVFGASLSFLPESSIFCVAFRKFLELRYLRFILFSSVSNRAFVPAELVCDSDPLRIRVVQMTRFHRFMGVLTYRVSAGISCQRPSDVYSRHRLRSDGRLSCTPRLVNNYIVPRVGVWPEVTLVG